MKSMGRSTIELKVVFQQIAFLYTLTLCRSTIELKVGKRISIEYRYGRDESIYYRIESGRITREGAIELVPESIYYRIERFNSILLSLLLTICFVDLL